MSNIVDFFAPGLPATKGSTKAFVIKGTNRAIITNNDKRAKSAAAVITLAARTAMKGRVPLAGPIHVRLEFYFPRPQSHLDRYGIVKATAPRFMSKRPDLDKCIRNALDAMTNVVFSDDARVCRIEAVKDYSVPDVGVRIVVSEWEGA